MMIKYFKNHMQEDQNLKMLYAPQFKLVLKDALTGERNGMIDADSAKALTTLCGGLL